MRGRLKRKDEYNLRTWREEREIDAQVKLAAEFRTKREEKSYQTTSSFRKTHGFSKDRNRPGTEGYLNRRTSRELSGKVPNIGGLTLIYNPFDSKLK